MKQNLYITLFEPQLIRNYLLADKSNFLSNLSNDFNLVIITNTELNALVNEGINKAKLQGSVNTLNFDGYRYSFLTRLIGFILYWGNQSPTIKLKIGKFWFEEKNIGKTIIKLIINRSLPSISVLIQFYRFLFKKSIKVKILKDHFNRSIDIDHTDLLFITSLTNNLGDLPVGVLFNNSDARIVGTVRSWDNLTSHGYIKLIPDVFLSHSEMMLSYAMKYQCISNSNIIEATAPVYQKSFRRIKSNKSSSKIKISYTCMGTSANPDDENLVRWLITQWHTLPNTFHLTILQHPKFVMNFDDVNLPENISIEIFRYENSNLIDYYDFIAKQSVIVCGGTTAALDSAFVGTSVVAIGFEIFQQNYWVSALRYFDVKPHTKDFFENTNFLVVKTKDELIKSLMNYKDLDCLEGELLSRFTGKNEIDFDSVVLNVFKGLH